MKVFRPLVVSSARSNLKLWGRLLMLLHVDDESIKQRDLVKSCRRQNCGGILDGFRRPMDQTALVFLDDRYTPKFDIALAFVY